MAVSARARCILATVFALILMWIAACESMCPSPLSPSTRHSPSPTPGPESSAQVPDLGDGGFLSGTPCGPPCFWGIVPGQTTEEEVIAILGEHEVLAACRFYNREAEGGTRGIHCGPRFQGFGVSFAPGSDLVEVISFRTSVTITVQDVIAKYGAPDCIRVMAEGISEHPEVGAGLVYLELLAYLGLPSQEDDVYLTMPSTRVEVIAYSELNVRDLFLEDCVTWRGYGEY